MVFKHVGKTKVRICVHCKKELNRWQHKYCSTHAIIVKLQQHSKFARGLTEQQLRHWYGF